jgi:hypothetical protein
MWPCGCGDTNAIKRQGKKNVRFYNTSSTDSGVRNLKKKRKEIKGRNCRNENS